MRVVGVMLYECVYVRWIEFLIVIFHSLDHVVDVCGPSVSLISVHGERTPFLRYFSL